MVKHLCTLHCYVQAWELSEYSRLSIFLQLTTYVFGVLFWRFCILRRSSSCFLNICSCRRFRITIQNHLVQLPFALKWHSHFTRICPMNNFSAAAPADDIFPVEISGLVMLKKIANTWKATAQLYYSSYVIHRK